MNKLVLFFRYIKLWVKWQNRIFYLKVKGEVLEKEREQAVIKQSECTHLKGGYAIIGGVGNARYETTGNDIGQYAVIKHQFANGDY